MLIQLVRRFLNLLNPPRPVSVRSARYGRRWFAPNVPAILEGLESRQMLSNLTIIPTFDKSITGDANATAIENTINGLIANYEAAFSDPITVNITFNETSNFFGNTNGSSVSQVQVATSTIPYSTFLADLKNNASTNTDQTALANLPTTDPITGQQDVTLTSANRQALDPTFVPVANDNTISFPDTALLFGAGSNGSYAFYAVAARALDEVLGFGSGLDTGTNAHPLDFFRYDQNGSRSYSIDSTQVSYFSLDGTHDYVQFYQGTSNPADPNQSNEFSYGDWIDDPQNPHVQNVSIPTGVSINPDVEYMALDAIGYHYLGEVDIALSNYTVQEHNNPLTIVGQILPVGGTASGWTYSLPTDQVSNDNAEFTIDANGNLATNAVLDIKTQSTFSVLIKAVKYDAYNNAIRGEAYEKYLKITLTPGDPSPRTLIVDVIGDVDKLGTTTLRDAIEVANVDNPGDRIIFASKLSPNGAPFTISLTQGELAIKNAMSIVGSGYSNGTPVATIAANGKNRVFEVFTSDAVNNVVLRNLGITGGSDQEGGGVYNAGGVAGHVGQGSLTLINNKIFGNSTTPAVGTVNGGGGVFNYYGNLISQYNTISGNTAAGDDNTINVGGGICNFGGSLSSTNDVIQQNSVTGTAGSLEVAGGGIFNSLLSGTMTIVGARISGNSVRGGGAQTASFGGGIGSNSPITISVSSIDGNSVSSAGTALGGGIYSDSTMSSTNDTYYGNSAGTGGGIYDSGSIATTTNDTIAANSGGGVGMSGNGKWNSLNTLVATNAGGDVQNQAGIINATSTLIGDGSPNTGLTDGVNGNIINPINQVILTGGFGFYGGYDNSFANSAETTAPLAENSPAIGAGSSLGTVTADNGANTLTVSDTTFFAVGDTLKIGTDSASEIVIVSGIASATATAPGTLTVQRASDLTKQIDLTGKSAYLATDAVTALRLGNDLGARNSQHNLIVNSTGDSLDTTGTLGFVFTQIASTIPGCYDNHFSSMNLRAAVTIANADVRSGTSSRGDTITFASSLFVSPFNGNPITPQIFLGSVKGGNIGQLLLTQSISIINDNKDSNGKLMPVEVDGYQFKDYYHDVFEIKSPSANITISGLTITNGASQLGGGIVNYGNLILSNDNITGNLATWGSTSFGGGIANLGTLTLSNVTVTGNKATNLEPGISPAPPPNTTNYGGGIYNTGSLTVLNSTISNNVVTGAHVNSGGGIYSSGPISITASTISGNTVTGLATSINSGGGVAVIGKVTFVNDTFALNTVQGTGNPADQVRGGGVYTQGTLTTVNDTFNGNTVANGGTVSLGGGIYNLGTWNSINTIVFGDNVVNGKTVVSGSNGRDVYSELASGTVINVHNTLIGDDTTSAGTSPLKTGVDGNIINPTNQNIFNANGLTNNGGPTNTILPATGSPVINSGAALGKVIADNTDTISVDNISYITVGDLLRIGSEIVQVDGITPISTGNAGTLSIVRAQNNTKQINLTGKVMIPPSDQLGNFRVNVDMGSVAVSTPMFLNDPGTTFIVGTPKTFQVTVSGIVPPIVTYTVVSPTNDGKLPAGITFTAQTDTTPGTLSGTAAAKTGGTYTVTFTADYGFGTPLTQVFTLTVDQAPAITSVASAGFIAGQANTFKVMASGFPTPTFSVSGLPPSTIGTFSLDPNSGLLTGTPLAGKSGIYTLTITATNTTADGATLTGTQTFTLTVGQPPTINANSTATFVVGTAGTFNVTTTGTPNVLLTATGLPASSSGLTFNATNGTLNGTPNPGYGGTYNITFTASSGVPNDATKNVVLTINELPSISVGTIPTFTVKQSNTINLTASGFPNPTFTFSGKPSWLNFDPNALTLSGTPAVGSGGTVTFQITATNTFGGTTHPVMKTITLIVNESPSIISPPQPPPAAFVVGNLGSFTPVATGFPTPFTWSETSGQLPTWAMFDPNTGTIKGTPTPASSGKTYNLMFKVSNSIGSATKAFTLTVDQTPVITSSPSATFTVGTPGSFTFTANGFPKPTWSISNNPSWLTVDPISGVLSANANGEKGGSYAFTVMATNEVKTASQSFTLTVNQAPSITNTFIPAFKAGTQSSFQLITSGFPIPSQFTVTGPVQTAVDGLPAGLTFDKTLGLLSGTPAKGTGGTYTLTFTASNGIGSAATTTLSLVVNEDLSFTNSTVTSFAIGKASTFAVTVVGYPIPTTVALSNSTPALPSNITFNSSTKLLSYTGTVTPAQTYLLTFKASNSNGTVTQNVTLTVGQPPVITTAGSAVFTVGLNSSFKIIATGSPTVPTISVTGLPSWLTYSQNSQTFSGTPPTGSGGIYKLTITAQNNVGTGAIQNFVLIVNEPPKITSSPTVQFVAGKLNSFTVTTIGYPAPKLTHTSLIPSGTTKNTTINSRITFNDATGVLSGTPLASDVGTYTLTINGKNSRNETVQQTITLTISLTALIKSASSAAFVAGSSSQFAVATSGISQPTFAFVGSLPSGVTLDSTTGLLSGTPATNSAGTYHLTITASNSTGAKATQSFTLTVRAATVLSSALKNQQSGTV